MLVNWQLKRTFWRFMRIIFVTVQKQHQESYFREYFPSHIRGYFRHTNEIKSKNRGYYSSNNLQKNKRETTEIFLVFFCLESRNKIRTTKESEIWIYKVLTKYDV